MRPADNPFRSERLDALPYRAPDFEWTAFEARWETLSHRGALVGPEGSGKTALLLDFSRRLTARGQRVHAITLRADEPVWTWSRTTAEAAACPADAVVMLDGADLLGAAKFTWFRFRVKHTAGFLATTHQPDWLPTLRLCDTSPALLDELHQELTGRPLGAEAAEVWLRHDGNLRDSLRELYDRADHG